jgi:hypothetical protein
MAKGSPLAQRPHCRRAGAGFVPVVEGEGQENRPRRRLQGGGDGPHEGGRYVLSSHRLIGPLHPRAGQHGGLDVREPRFHQHHFARLLPMSGPRLSPAMLAPEATTAAAGRSPRGWSSASPSGGRPGNKARRQAAHDAGRDQHSNARGHEEQPRAHRRAAHRQGQDLPAADMVAEVAIGVVRERFLVSLATLSLLSRVAEERPLCAWSTMDSGRTRARPRRFNLWRGGSWRTRCPPGTSSPTTGNAQARPAVASRAGLGHSRGGVPRLNGTARY